MTDRYGRYPAEILEAARNAFTITPSDVTVFEQPTRGIYIGGAGDLVVDFMGYDDEAGAVDVTFVGLPTGTLIPLRAVKVKAATTATNLLGIY
jgi:hypothetical protein